MAGWLKAYVTHSQQVQLLMQYCLHCQLLVLQWLPVYFLKLPLPVMTTEGESKLRIFLISATFCGIYLQRMNNLYPKDMHT
jgi:hypothetical protein